MTDGNYGREVVFEWNGTEIPGVREKNLTINGEAVNVTSDEDDGVQVLLDEDAEVSIEYQVTGVSKSMVLRQAKATGNIRGTITVTYPDGAVMSFAANLGPYSEGKPYNEAVTFDATFMSSGAITYTPGSTA
jgi:predicted secreted protein